VNISALPSRGTADGARAGAFCRPVTAWARKWNREYPARRGAVLKPAGANVGNIRVAEYCHMFIWWRDSPYCWDNNTNY